MSQQYKEKLYHGTVSEISSVDVSKGRGNKDFGKGFYMAVTKRQAVGMMHKKYREAVRRSRNKKKADFSDFVLMCREQGGVPHDYDVVIGPTADDDTMLCLKAYWDGLYGKVGSTDAKRILLNNLEPENLGIQYYVGRQKVADRLIKEIRPVEWR